MSTLDTIVKDYDKNIVLRDCQRQAFEYLHDKKGDLLVTTFETFTEIESLARTDNFVWEIAIFASDPIFELAIYKLFRSQTSNSL